MPEQKETVLNPRQSREIRRRISKHYKRRNADRELADTALDQIDEHGMLFGAWAKTSASNYFTAHEREVEQDFVEDLPILSQSGLLAKTTFLETVNKLAAKEVTHASVTSTSNVIWPYQFQAPERSRVVQTCLKLLLHAVNNTGNLYKMLGIVDRPTMAALSVDLAKFRTGIDVVRSVNGFGLMSADLTNINKICEKYSLKNILRGMMFANGFWQKNPANTHANLMEFRDRVTEDQTRRIFMEKLRGKAFARMQDELQSEPSKEIDVDPLVRKLRTWMQAVPAAPPEQKRADEAFVKKHFGNNKTPAEAVPTNTTKTPDAANVTPADTPEEKGGGRGKGRGRGRGGKGLKGGKGGKGEDQPRGGGKRQRDDEEEQEPPPRKVRKDEDRSEGSFQVEAIRKEVAKVCCISVEELAQSKEVRGFHLGHLCGVQNEATGKASVCRNKPGKCGKDSSHKVAEKFQKQLKKRAAT
eukprot:g1420.t1